MAEFGKTGDGEGEFTCPAGIALNSQENLYVADEWLNRIIVFDRGVGKWHQQTVAANADTQKARHRAFNLAREWLLQKPRGVAFDPVKQRPYCFKHSHWPIE